MAEGGLARIVVAERWSILRRGIIGTLETRHPTVDGLDDVAALARVLCQGQADVAIIGDGPGLDLATVVAHLRDSQPSVRLILLYDQIDPFELRTVMKAGARAVLSKRVGNDALLYAVERVLSDERVVDQPFLPLLFGTEDPSDKAIAGTPHSLLTRRQHEVLGQLASGASNLEIASSLFLSESTVKSHLRQIYAKLKVNGRHGAVGRALELELLN